MYNIDTYLHFDNVNYVSVFRNISVGICAKHRAISRTKSEDADRPEREKGQIMFATIFASIISFVGVILGRVSFTEGFKMMFKWEWAAGPFFTYGLLLVDIIIALSIIINFVSGVIRYIRNEKDFNDRHH